MTDSQKRIETLIENMRFMGDGEVNAVQSKFDPPLDPGIARAVEVLSGAGIETYESCQGGDGHAFTEPTVRFYGDKSEGFRALDIAMKNGLPVRCLRRFWSVIDGEPVGPNWELVLIESRNDYLRVVASEERAKNEVD